MRVARVGRSAREPAASGDVALGVARPGLVLPAFGAAWGPTRRWLDDMNDELASRMLRRTEVDD
jgi:hypothetical protein